MPLVMDEKEYARQLIQQVIDTPIQLICNDTQKGFRIATGSMTIPSAKTIAVMMVELALKEAYKRGDGVALLRQEYLKSVKAEIPNV